MFDIFKKSWNLIVSGTNINNHTLNNVWYNIRKYVFSDEFICYYCDRLVDQTYLGKNTVPGFNGLLASSKGLERFNTYKSYMLLSGLYVSIIEDNNPTRYVKLQQIVGQKIVAMGKTPELLAYALGKNSIKSVNKILTDNTMSEQLQHLNPSEIGFNSGISNSVLLKNNPDFLKLLCANDHFPRAKFLAQFSQDWTREVKEGGESRVTVNAICILGEVPYSKSEEREERINNQKSLSSEKQDLLGALPDNLFSSSTKSARSVAEKDSPEEEISDKPRVIQESAEKVDLTAKWFPLTDWQKTPLLLCWHTENNENRKPFLGDAARVYEDAFPTYEALLAEVD